MDPLIRSPFQVPRMHYDKMITNFQDSNNPAWRGLQQQEAVQMRTSVGGFAGPHAGQFWPGNRMPRYLYDHKNPNKPIPAPSHPGPGPMRPPSGNVARFSVDTRYAHPPPPFPSMKQPPPNARLLLDSIAALFRQLLFHYRNLI
jgi:hypothetical protein